MSKNKEETSKRHDNHVSRDSNSGKFTPEPEAGKRERATIKESGNKREGETDHTGPRDSAE